MTLVFFSCRQNVTVDVKGVPDAPPTTDTSTKTFAIDALFLGDSDRNGHPPNNTAWQSFGEDIDGVTTTTTSTNVCTRAAGAPPTNQVDGQSGIDNAWGSVLLPLFQSLLSLPAPSSAVSARIADGEWTLQIQARGLSDDASQTASGLDVQVFNAGETIAPAFDATTNWPVLASSVVDGSLISSGAFAHFSTAIVQAGVLVARDSQTPIVVPMFVQGVTVTLRIHNATLVFVHDAPSDASVGLIAGVLDTAELVETLRDVAKLVSTSLCGSVFDGIAQQIQQAQDILHDGTNKPGVDCDAISIGLGFTAKQIANPTTVVSDPPPPPDPCVDGGTD